MQVFTANYFSPAYYMYMMYYRNATTDQTASSHTLNESTSTFGTPSTTLDFFDTFGPSHPEFKLVHYAAVISLTISIIISLYTLIHSIRSGSGHILKRKIGRC